MYLISGIAMNHKDTFNPQYDITVLNYTLENPLPEKSYVDKDYIESNLLNDIDEKGNYTKHYFPNDRIMKVFLKSGSNLTVNTATGNVTYERVRRRPILGAMSRLHYNPGKAWTWFADIFSVSMIIVVISGLILLKGKNGIIGIGGIEFLIGILIPVMFILLG